MYQISSTICLVVGQLMAHGYDINFHDTYCKIFNPNKEFVAKIYMTKNRLFPFEMRSGNMYACNLSNANETKLWHYHYGHLPVKSMSLLQKESMVKGFPSSINETPCESCIVGKNQRYSFPSASYRSKHCLELVHTYLCGPMQNQSIVGNFYF